MRASTLGALLAIAAGFAPVAGARGADRDDELIAPPIDAAHPADLAAGIAPPISKACIDAGFAEGSAEHRHCALELIAVLETRRAAALPLGATPARLTRGLNLGQACAGYFPAASRSAHEEGTVSLLIYVGAEGRVKEVVRLESTGYQRLDVATAQCLYREGRFTPNLVNGAPVGSWQRMRYTWRLH